MFYQVPFYRRSTLGSRARSAKVKACLPVFNAKIIGVLRVPVSRNSPILKKAGEAFSGNRVYAQTIRLGLLGKFVTLSSGYIIVILLNRILGKDIYGEYVFFQTVFAYVIIFGTLGLDRLIIYKLSQFSEEAGTLVGRDLLIESLRRAIAFTILIEAVLVVGWAIHHGSLETGRTLFWIVLFSLNSIAAVCASLFASLLQANKLGARTVRVGTRVRLVSLAIIFGIFSLTDNYYYLVLFLLVPSVYHVGALYFASAGLPDLKSGIRIKPKDTRYALTMMTTNLVHTGVERIDLLMIGLFLPLAHVADYRVAALFASLVTVGNTVLGPLFSPRFRYLLEAGDTTSIVREYRYNKNFSSFMALGMMAVILVAGEWLLLLVGDYAQAYPVMLVLSTAFFNKVFPGPSGRYLILAGQSGITLLTTLSVLALMILLNAYAIPRYGTLGAAYATLLALLALNIVLVLYIERKTGIAFLRFYDWLILAIVNLVSLIVVFEL